MRKYLAVLLTLLLLTAACTAYAANFPLSDSSSGRSGVYGDLNNNGSVDIMDLMLLAQQIGMNLSGMGDWNGNGRIDIADVMYQARLVAGSPQPAPSISLDYIYQTAMLVPPNDSSPVVNGKKLSCILEGLTCWGLEWAPDLISGTGFSDALFPGHSSLTAPVIQAALNTERYEYTGYDEGRTGYREHEIIALCSAMYGGEKIDTQHLNNLYNDLANYTAGWMYYQNGYLWVQEAPMHRIENVVCMAATDNTYRFSTFTADGDGQSTVFDLTVQPSAASPLGFTVAYTIPQYFAIWWTDPPEYYPYEEW